MMDPTAYPFPKKRRDLLLILIGSLLTADILMGAYALFIRITVEDGTSPSLLKIIMFVSEMLMIYFPIFGSVLGFLLGLIPFGKLSYRQRVFPATLYTLLVIYSVFFVVGVVGAFWSMMMAP